MSPVVVHQTSPRETLNTRHKIRYKKVSIPDHFPEHSAYLEVRRHSNTESRADKKTSTNKPRNPLQLHHAKLHQSQPQLLDTKARRTSDPGKNGALPKWTHDIQQCPTLTKKPWYPLNEESWGISKDKRKTPNQRSSRYLLAKSRSYSSEYDPTNSSGNYVIPSTDAWRAPSSERKTGQVWYPRDTWSRSTKNVWYPQEGNPYHPHANPWYALEKPDDTPPFSRRDFASSSWRCEAPRLEPPVPIDCWYQRYGEGLLQAVELPRARETLNSSINFGQYLVGGTCRIPRASVRRPRSSRRSIRSVSSTFIPLLLHFL